MYHKIDVAVYLGISMSYCTVERENHMLHEADHHTITVDLLNCIKAMDPKDIWMECRPDSFRLFS